jgi:hypothetical protein
MPTTTVERTCPWCGKTYTKTFDTAKLNAGIEAYTNCALLQDAFPEPDFTASDREFLYTGICDECWKKLSSSCDELI